jgi:hypothetical protein
MACASVLACGDEPPESDRAPAAQSPPVSPPPTAVPSTAPPEPRRGCVGPGSTREQVRELLGEPDSIVGGWWYYGRTQFHLGSGTVQDYISGGNTPIC